MTTIERAEKIIAETDGADAVEREFTDCAINWLADRCQEDWLPIIQKWHGEWIVQFDAGQSGDRICIYHKDRHMALAKAVLVVAKRRAE